MMSNIFSQRHAICEASKTSQFFKSLLLEALSDFESLASFMYVPANTALFVEEQPCGEVFLLLDGQVKLSMNSSDGKRLILRIAKAGEALGLACAFTGNPYEMTAEAVYPCYVAATRREDFLRLLLRYPSAFQGAARELALYYDEACLRLRTIGVTPSVTKKLARLLLEWSANGQRTEHGTRVHITLTRGEIGECIGTSRETVTRILGDFQRRQIVDLRGSFLTVIDLPLLESCAGM